MTFQRLILSEIHCPRCNAIAQERVEEERADACVVYIVCNKCKLHRYRGLTTRRAITLMSQEKILIHRLETEGLTQQAQSRIRGKIVKIREQITKENLRVGS